VQGESLEYPRPVAEVGFALIVALLLAIDLCLDARPNGTVLHQGLELAAVAVAVVAALVGWTRYARRAAAARPSAPAKPVPLEDGTFIDADLWRAIERALRAEAVSFHATGVPLSGRLAPPPPNGLPHPPDDGLPQPPDDVLPPPEIGAA
jgi:hypothetical protein